MPTDNTMSAWTRRNRGSEFSMDSYAEDIHRSAIAVESGVDDVLVVTGEPECFSKVHTVKQIQRSFRPFRDRTITDKSIDSSKAEVLCVRIGNPAQIQAKIGNVQRTRPPGPFGQGSE